MIAPNQSQQEPLLDATLQSISDDKQAVQADASTPVPQTNGKVAIKATNVNFFYGTFQALKNINISAIERSITALIGPSGCGKTTFLRTLNRMCDLVDGTRVEGEILLHGNDINARGVDVVHLRKQVGMVFQKPNPFPMSIYDNIAYGPRIHGVRARKALDEIVERTLRGAALWDEVKDSLKKSAFELSGGQQQRLCIARTLSVDPEIILMDEPCSALDPNSTFRIEQLMEDLARDYTIVIVTHNMQQAARVSKQTGFFLRGELREFGETAKIFTNPDDSETEAYVSGRFG
jgi:phosphate transport system ATP-binding protein